MSGFRIWIHFTKRSQDMVYIIIIHDVNKISLLQSLEQISLKELLSTQPSNLGTQCPSKYANLKQLRLLRNFFRLIIFSDIEYL